MPTLFGVPSEDLVVVTDDGREVLTGLDRTLRILG
jgi:Xaa-Pro aminopeptidase